MAQYISQTGIKPAEAFCDVTCLSYLQIGESGPVVVLLHGWGAFKEIWWSTMLALAGHGRVVAPDMPGHGGSPLKGNQRIVDIASRIGEFCTVNEFQPMMLVGHSLSGNVALELALMHPELVNRLVLVAPVTNAHLMPAYTRLYLRGFYGWAILRIMMLIQRYLGLVGRRVPHVHGGGFVRPLLRRAAYYARQDVISLHTTFAGLFDNPIGSRLADLRIPTLVITGALDSLVPVALSRQVARSIPGAQYVVIRGAAHNPMDDQPRAFEQALLNFLYE